MFYTVPGRSAFWLGPLVTEGLVLLAGSPWHRSGPTSVPIVNGYSTIG